MYFGCDITKKDRNTEIRVNFGEFRGDVCNQLILNTIKKRPNTIPVFVNKQEPLLKLMC